MTRFPMVSPKNAHEKIKIFFAKKIMFFLAAVAADRVQGKDTHGKKGTKFDFGGCSTKKTLEKDRETCNPVRQQQGHQD